MPPPLASLYRKALLAASLYSATEGSSLEIPVPALVCRSGGFGPGGRGSERSQFVPGCFAYRMSAEMMGTFLDSHS